MSNKKYSISRRDALTGIASASTVLLAGCSTAGSGPNNTTSDTATSDTEPTSTPAKSVMTTTPHVVPGNSTEINDNETSPSDPTITTSTPVDTPAETPVDTPQDLSETQDCKLEFSEEVMTQARDVGLEARDAVVWLYHNKVGKEDIMGGIGTGWFIDDTHIVTNGHIIDQNNGEDGSFRAITINNTSHELEVVDYVYNINPTRDVALLKLKDGSAPHALTLGDTDSLEEGQPLIQIGHPATIGNWLIALGTYTGRSPGINSNSLTTEMPSYSGNSGSPMLTLDGDVVGLHYASTTENYAGDPPTPIDEDVDEARVYTELPYQKRKSAVAEPIEDVTSHLSDWRN